MNMSLSFVARLLAAASLLTPHVLQAAVPSDVEIRKILVERIDTHHQAVGIVVGVIEPQGQRIVAYGTRAKGANPVDGDTVFEIGSITKVFTSVLLAEMVQRGEVALSDPVSKFVPPEVKVPERGGRTITLVDLSTHTSGLPREPTNLPKPTRSTTIPYSGYSVDSLYQFLSTYPLPRDIGTGYEYSNIGPGLLGHALMRAARMDYEPLMRDRVLAPLGMKSSGITLSPDMRANLAQGYDGRLEPMPAFEPSEVYLGSGSLRSTANDMLRFLAAAMDYQPSPLSPAFKAMLATRRPTSNPRRDAALGWTVSDEEGTELVWRNGGTPGFKSWIGYQPSKRTGVVVLMNSFARESGPDDIGSHLLNPENPLQQKFAQPKPVPSRTEIQVPARTFDRYVGRYQFAPAVLIEVSRDGNRYFVQFTGKPPTEIFAESDTDYFVKIIDAKFRFETNARHEVTALVLRKKGVEQRAPRIEGEPVVPKEVTLDPTLLDTYVGEYRLPGGTAITISRQGALMFAQLTGQAAAEIFSTGPREFFYKVVNAQLTFEVDEQGAVTAVVVHQLGANLRADRVK